MKKIACIILLTFISLVSSAQKSVLTIKQLAIVYGDSTSLREKYEINLKKRKIYSITAIMNYLHIKGVKYRTPIKINGKKWTEIRGLINSIDFNNLELVNEKNAIDSMYVIEILTLNNETSFYSVRNDAELEKLNHIFTIIRKSK